MANPLTSRDHELLSMDRLSISFPVKFDNGAIWTGLEGKCRDCGEPVPSSSLRGLVTRPIPSVVVIEAVGICHPCKLVTRFDYRLHDDMRITGRSDAGWATWKSEPSLLNRFMRSLKRLLKENSS